MLRYFVTELVTSHENQEVTLALTGLFSPEQHSLLLGSIYMIQSNLFSYVCTCMCLYGVLM